MKCSAFFTAAAFAVVCLLQPSSAEEQASVHLRINSVEQSPSDNICYVHCDSGMYCPKGETTCRKPNGTECFNPATALFIPKCSKGFYCSNGRCEYQ
ncbi:RxLR-like protein [Plasmopara halstedii]|uniref:RxLR-like protein n=1 Tax=Plasmopara halstedii TaxID=4781 RepID=A0A0P1AA26_PLAHL|nr:RxLR-like protein [Plasmopara halstedii]CEG37488.1 RxLR-like protein [Plasmopara halstedii]|eukprot:XP_024573857.1 RxLR-like protein [Plasmopara halstedii]